MASSLEARVKKLERVIGGGVIIILAQPREGETKEQAGERAMREQGIVREPGTICISVDELDLAT